eukprot:NODE_1064_length_1254_cov_225.091743.p1 GENE.NODE_1064_length_1254_cov_225.091743~~NODE_1064_length_1254_cov_225.091743.p1  ORF type:complete len:220 (+),score=54.23 NODE_1064_length_1254_cov_225.091743:3-662(+)
MGFKEILEDADWFYVVMPRCNGGELFKFLVNEVDVPEEECKRIMREILFAIGNLHEHNLLHRDVKPENILFNRDPSSEPDSPEVVKLIDFDTVTEHSPGSSRGRRFAGTPGYIAPEALLGKFVPQSDLWSVGVILHFLMTGKEPWTFIPPLDDGTVGSPGANQMHRAMRHELAALDWTIAPWPQFPLARDLCQKLLAWKVADRPATAQVALGHAWLRGG